MVSLRGTEDLDHVRKQAVCASTHVHRLHRHPQRVDADHFRSSRAQAAHCDAAPMGQLTFIVTAPRRTSMSMVASSADIDRHR